MIGVIIVLSVLVALLASVVCWMLHATQRENRRLVNLLVAQNPREFAAIQSATEPALEPAPERQVRLRAVIPEPEKVAGL